MKNSPCVVKEKKSWLKKKKADKLFLCFFMHFLHISMSNSCKHYDHCAVSTIHVHRVSGTYCIQKSQVLDTMRKASSTEDLPLMEENQVGGHVSKGT